ncbi:hypothetical protein ACLOJK_033560 [Asimina triloba]
MAARCMEMGLVAVLMAVMWAGAEAQLGCTPAIVGLTPCISYVTGNSSTPAPTCCSQLASIVSSQPQCLCAVLSSGSSSMLGFSLNQTQALTLPTACNVQTPPVSQCNAAGGPATAPAEAPAAAAAATSPSEPTTASAPATPSAPSLPSDKPSSPTVPSPTQASAPSAPRNASKTVPSTSKNTSGASSTAVPLSVLVALASFAASLSNIE